MAFTSDELSHSRHFRRGLAQTFRSGALMMALVLVIAVPAFVVLRTEFAPATPFIVTGAVPVFIAALFGLRLAWGTLGVTVLFVACAELVNPWPWAVAVLMAAAGLGLGICARNGWTAVAVQACIWCSLTLIAPPLELPGIDWASGRLGQVLVPVWMALMGGLWAVAVSAVLKSRLPRLSEKPLSRVSAARYGGALAVLLGSAAFVASTWFTEATGGWLLLTILVIVRPDLADTWGRVVSRSVGTVLGGAAAALAGSVFGNQPLLLNILAAVSLIVAVVLLVRKANYAVYAFALTVAVVLMNMDGSDVLTADIQRVGFTLAGAVLVAILAASYEFITKRGSLRRVSS
jgi:hypothetical protein